MKKLIMALVLMPLMALADAEKIGDVTWSYKISSEKVTVKGADPCEGRLEIPQTLGGYPVSSIGAAAFSDLEGLTEMVIPEGVADIGAAAFCDCIGLTMVTIPSSVESIGDAAFEGCESLATVRVSAGDVEGVKAMIADSDSGIDVDSLTFVEPLPDGGPYTETVDGIEWTFEIIDGVASVGAYHAIPYDTVGAIEIPSTLGGCPVMSIGDNAFSGCIGLTSVTISEGVTSIGDYAFWNCIGLTLMTIPEGVTSIGEYAFEWCCGLTSVTIPSSVTNIGDWAFSGCSGLTSISVSEGNASYSSADGILYDKAKTELVCCPAGKVGDMTIPSGVTSIGDGAFYDCIGLTSVTIPSSVTSIGEYAFEWCCGLTSLTISEGVTSIGFEAFYGCSGLSDADGFVIVEGVLFEYYGDASVVTIPSSVTSIGDFAFRGCSGLTGVTIPSSVTSIGDNAFDSCSGLTSVTIPEGVTSIGDFAFRGCSGLTSVTISEGVQSIGVQAFDACSGLTSVAIPSSVTSIGAGAFSGCSGLTSVTISEGVTSIGDGAFDGCSGLTSVTIPSSVTSIGDFAFRGCSGLKTVRVVAGDAERVKAMIADSGSGIDVDSLTFAEMLEDGGPYTETVDGIEWTFEIIDGEASVGACVYEYGYYECAIPYDTVGAIKIPSTLGGCPVTSIGDEAFYGCIGLTSVTIPSSVTSIGDYAFYDCRGLTSVTIPSSVTSIGDYAFYACRGLTSVTIPSSVTSIGDHAFYYCSGLTSVTISEGVTSIGDYAFYYCSGLTSVTIPSSVTSIGELAFQYCRGLRSVTIPEGVTSIGDEAFSGCIGLMSVTIPSSVTSIGIRVFEESLRRVNFAGAVPRGWTGALPVPATKFYYNKDYAAEWEKAQKDVGIPGEGTPYDVTTSAIVPQVAGCVTVSNVVVHYILNSVQPEFAIHPADDMNFVNIITEVKGSAAVAIPETWAANYPGFAEKFGTDFTQALMKPTGKIGTGGTPMLVWQDYVAGTDPTNEKDVFTASITIVDGKVTISYTPELDDARKAMRKYTTWGKASLMDTDWTEVQDGHEAAFNFFKVSVEMR